MTTTLGDRIATHYPKPAGLYFATPAGELDAQASLVARMWRQTGRDRRRVGGSSSSVGDLSAWRSLTAGNVQPVLGSVRQPFQRRQRQLKQNRPQRRSADSASLPISGPGWRDLVGGAAQAQPAPTSAAFSTADIRQALRLLVAKSSPQQRAAPIKPPPEAPAPNRAHLEAGRSVETRALRQRRPALSPVRLAPVKFKSNSGDHRQHCRQQQKSEKYDLWRTVSGGGQLETCECGFAVAARVVTSAYHPVEPSGQVDGEIRSRGESMVSRDDTCCWLDESGERWANSRAFQRRSEPIEELAAGRHEYGREPFEPDASYANGNRKRPHGPLACELSTTTTSIGELIPSDFQHKQPTRTTASKQLGIEAETEAMTTTESFVPTDLSSQQQQPQQTRNQALAPEELGQPSSRLIGLGCPRSARASSSSLSSDEQDSQQDQGRGQDNGQHRGGNNLGDSSNGTSQAVAGRYTIMSSSSVVSLSDESERAQHCGQVRRASGPVSSSTSGLNQRAAGKNLIGKFVGKKATRIRELLLQNLGRADRTTDDLFDLYEMNFYKQQQHVQQLIREFKLYTAALKSYQEANKNLSKCVQQSTSDYHLARHDLVCDSLSQLDQLNEHQMKELQEKVTKCLGDYMARFDEIKEKINKRHRKLIDYDSSRRLYELMFARVSKKRSNSTQQQQQQQQSPPQQQQNYQSILRGLKFLSQQQQQQQPSNGHHNQEAAMASQLVDEARLLKLREQYNYCKLMYETINNELHEELPNVYEQKMKSLLSALQNYYDITAHHNSEAGKLLAKVSDAMIVLSPHSAGAGNTLLSVYADDESGEKSASKAARELAGTGSGSSGVSLSGSASRSSGSSLASPECGEHEDDVVVDQRRRQAEHDDGHHEDDDQQQQGPKNVEGPADSESSARHYGDASMGSVGGQPSESSALDSIPVASAAEVAAAAAAQHFSADENDSSQAIAKRSGLVAGDRDDDDNDERAQADPEPDEYQLGAAKTDAEQSRTTSVEKEHVQLGLVVPVVSASADEADDDEERAMSNGEQKEYMYRVRTNYKYLAEDVDELSFEANEIIQVVEFDESHEPEDGWLLGVREVNRQRGLFPANFTQPI
jgi:hypothetical protein